MKYINFIILMVFCFTLMSCKREELRSMSLKKSVINKTDRELFYFAKTDEGEKSSYVAKNDSSVLSFYRGGVVEIDWFPIAGTVRQREIITEQEILYNITDTTVYIFNVEYEHFPLPVSEQEQIYSSHLKRGLEDESTDRNGKIIMQLTVTDSILDIMEKNYSMLDKFPEYYHKK